VQTSFKTWLMGNGGGLVPNGISKIILEMLEMIVC
jgi:hypothetical protein